MEITYVTYDDVGNLTGFYTQELQPAHQANYIELIGYPLDFYMWWVNYRANEARDGLELIPPPEDLPLDDSPSA